MSRIPAHTVEDAPEASRELLRDVIQFSPTGRPLNMHAQMAHSPAVMVAYTSLRAATAEHGTLGPQVSSALMLATASAVGNDYVVGITSRLAGMMGWTEQQVAALRAGTTLGDNKIDVLTGLVREAAVNAGNVEDATWAGAQDAGCNDAQLAEAFAYLGLTVFTAYFLNYAQTEIDI
jgi:alkylhydroperoxidase family enzyme